MEDFIGMLEYVERENSLGIRDMPTRPFVEGRAIKEILQSAENRDYD